MILHYSMTSFPDTAGQAVQNVIHLSRCLPDLIGQYKRANACCIMLINIP